MSSGPIVPSRFTPESMPVTHEVAALSTTNLSKRYGGVVALAGVDVTIAAGRVTALLGENGAGKSTFVACCSGARTPDQGTLKLEGEEVSFSDPHAAATAGIAVVHQEPQMLEEQSVAQNLSVAMLARGAGRMPSRKKLERSARDHLASVGLQDVLDPAEPVRMLSGAQRQLLEIARALTAKPKVLFLDEPNASLGDDETDLLFGVVDQLRSRGVAVVLVSHRLREVYRIADHVIVMRDGEKVADGPATEIGIDTAVTLMGGRPRTERPLIEITPSASIREPVVSLRNVSGDGFSDINLDLRPGEILGMAGLVGSGRTEIALGLIGARRVDSGEITINGVARRLSSPGDAVRRGVVYIAEDRKDAVFYEKSIEFNIRAGLIGARRRGGKRLREREARRIIDESIAKLGVKAESLDAHASTLSGGNQQKLLFARASAAQPRLLILDEPTHGVDIGTRQEIHSLIRQFADQGMAVWVISSELDEILDLAARIVVIREGCLAAEVPAGADPIPILAAAMGATTDQEMSA